MSLQKVHLFDNRELCQNFKTLLQTDIESDTVTS